MRQRSCKPSLVSEGAPDWVKCIMCTTPPLYCWQLIGFDKLISFLTKFLIDFFFLSVMLRWFVETHSVEMALTGTTLTEIHIKKKRHVSDAFRDHNIDVHRIKDYFSKSGWKKLLEMIQEKKKNDWACSVCSLALDNEQVGCDSCLEWYHFSCVGLSKQPKTKKWYCMRCYNNA